MIISQQLADVLDQNKVSQDQFLTLARTEELTEEEINDLDYMQDRIDTWKDHDLV